MKETLVKRIQELDLQKNFLRIDRKINFLLDVRGYFIVNQIKGTYVEFGCFKGEMLFSAYKVFDPHGICTSYIGLDTFEGEPVFVKGDAAHNKFNVKGDYSAPEYAAREMVKEAGKKVELIKGDFRNSALQKKLISRVAKPGINISVIDCNILSSIEVAADLTFQHIHPGGFLFVDDHYTNMSNGDMPVKDIIERFARARGFTLHHFQCYPPFAEAFIVVKDRG